jgi:hypothetical protein
MAAGGKKAKVKDKSGKAGSTKQKIKKTKTPEETEIQTSTESPASGNPEPVVKDQDLGQPLESTLEPAPEAAESTESSSAVRKEQFEDTQTPDPSVYQLPDLIEDHLDNESLLEENDAPEPSTELIGPPSESVEPPAEAEASYKLEDQSQEEHRSKALVTSPPFAPYSPALVPLPSPSLTEARFMSSASPEAHYYHPAPAYNPYASPYAAPVPYTSPYGSPYASPYGSPYASPIPKVSSPLARSHYPYMPPVMSPTATPTPPPPPVASAPPPQMAPPVQRPPSTAQSYTSAVHSPVMSSAGVVPPYAGYSQATDGNYMYRSYSMSDPSYAASFQAVRDLGLANGQPHDNGPMSPPENESEHIELLQRIQSALPDIDRLLHGFRSTHSRLAGREAEIKQIGNQHEQALMHKEFYIEALQAQMKKTANESAEETAKLKHTINELRLELGNLQEKQKDLEDGLATHQKSNEELSQSKSDLEAELAELKTSIQETRDAHDKEKEEQKEEHAKALLTQKQELTELFEEIKNEDEKAANETLAAREKTLADQHESQKVDWEKEKALMQDSLENQRTELETTKSELAANITALDSKERELEERLAELTSAQEEVTSKITELESKEKELEDNRTNNAQELETLQKGHASELDALRRSHAEELAAAVKGLDDKIAAIEAEFNGKEQHWTVERTALEKLLSEKDSELSSAEREKEQLEGDNNVKEQQLQRAVDEMRFTIDHLDKDCERLRKTLSSLGEATDLKTTKGDQFL